MEFEKDFAKELKPEPLLDGSDLINMGFKPGPIFSKILSEVEDLQLEGKISSKQEALKYVEENFTKE